LPGFDVLFYAPAALPFASAAKSREHNKQASDAQLPQAAHLPQIIC
jgi:hypothetical protein